MPPDWYSHNGLSPFNESDNGDYADPMAEMMRAMSRQPEVGYDFIREEGNADYFFDKRDWSHDGYDGIAALADRVSTDPAIYEAHPDEARHDRLPVRRLDGRTRTASTPTTPRPPPTAWPPALVVHALDGRRHGRRREDGDPRIHRRAGSNLPGYGELDNMPQFYRGDLAT